MEKKSFGFKGRITTVLVIACVILIVLFVASFSITVSEKPVVYLISGLFVLSIFMLLYEAMCYRYYFLEAQRKLEQEHEIKLIELKFEQEKEWRGIDKNDQERDSLKTENETLKSQLNSLSQTMEEPERERQFMVAYLLSIFNSDKTNSASKTEITLDDVKKNLDKNLENYQEIKKKIQEIKDGGL